MGEENEILVTVTTIAEVLGIKPDTVYMFLSRYKIPRKRKQGVKGIQVDARVYIARLRERGYDADADALEGHLREDGRTLTQASA